MVYLRLYWSHLDISMMMHQMAAVGLELTTLGSEAWLLTHCAIGADITYDDKK